MILIQTIVQCVQCSTRVAIPPGNKVEKKAARAAAHSKGWVTLSRRGQGEPADLCPECRAKLPEWLRV